MGDNCFANFTGDGRPELLLMNHADPGGAQLMADPGSGAFVQQTAFPAWDYHSCSPADFNRDGRLDVYLGAGGCAGGGCEYEGCNLCPDYPKRLYLQDPDGSFRDVASAWGVTEPTGRGRSSATFDVNNDGYPDLFTGNELPVNYPSPNRFFLNVGGTHMVDATALYGLPSSTAVGGYCVHPGDYDRDGFTDLIVCGYGRTYLYRNVGGTRFVDTGVTANITPTRPLRDAAWEDLDRDGDLDLLQQTWDAVYVRLNSGGRFGGDAYRLGTANGGYNLGTGDVDGDGDVDFFAVTARPRGATSNPPDYLMLNNGSGTGFTRLATPQVTAGDGDSATILPHWRGRKGALIVVNNGHADDPGPRQAIEIVAT
jgi:VCBS repeat protein